MEKSPSPPRAPRVAHETGHYVHCSYLLEEWTKCSVSLLHCHRAKAETGTVQMQKEENFCIWLENDHSS